MEMKLLYGAAEWRISRIEHLIHIWREARRHIPIVGFRKHMLAAAQPHMAIAHRLARPHAEQLPDLVRRLLVLIA